MFRYPRREGDRQAAGNAAMSAAGEATPNRVSCVTPRGVLRGGDGLGEHARRDSRVAGNQPTRAFGEVSPDKTRLHAERAWLNFNVAKPPPPLRRCGLVRQTSRNLRKSRFALARSTRG